MTPKKIFSTLFLALLFSAIFFLFQLYPRKKQQNLFQEKINTLSSDDQLLLRKEFKKLIQFSGFGYTLFGDKPISFDLYPSLDDFWKVWIKHRQEFPLNEYIFTQINYESCPGVLIANISSTRKTFRKNKEFFRKEIDANINEKDLILALSTGSGELFEKLFTNDAILGLLLGYGKKNSKNFAQRKILRLASKSTQIALLDEKLQPVVKPNLFWEIKIKHSPCLPLQFAADLHSEETKELREKYSKQRRSIEKAYRWKDPLMVTLQKLSQISAEKQLN